jgi:hypothetical protein
MVDVGILHLNTITPCRLVDRYQLFRGTYCFHLQLHAALQPDNTNNKILSLDCDNTVLKYPRNSIVNHSL